VTEPTRLPVINPPAAAPESTEVGSYFVATYPPFSTWTEAAVADDALPALHSAPVPGVPLGLYLHIPFCRKRCHFCYFRVYTDKNASEVADYLDVLATEWERASTLPAIAGRPLNFVYFGGGTPSFLSTKQLEGLVTRLKAATPWRDASALAFSTPLGARSKDVTASPCRASQTPLRPSPSAIASAVMPGFSRAAWRARKPFGTSPK